MNLLKRALLLTVLFVAVYGLTNAQDAARVDSSNTLLEYKTEVYDKVNIPSKTPVPLAYVREADVMFEKIVWRSIELREKRNQLLYYPTEHIGSRVNLVNLLLKGVDSGELTAYATDDPYNEFVRPMNTADIDLMFGAKKDTIFVDDGTGEFIAQPRIIDRQIHQVTRLLLKEKIYFDKKHSALNRVVIGICPIRVEVKGADEDGTGGTKVEYRTMWIYMPEARPLLARHPVFNTHNDAGAISFDDFFMQNRYDGHIVAVSNVYNNRQIREYMSGLDALYESQRIEREILDFEQDLWEY